MTTEPLSVRNNAAKTVKQYGVGWIPAVMIGEWEEGFVMTFRRILRSLSKLSPLKRMLSNC